MAQKIKRKKSFYRRVKENKKLQQINCILFPALFGVLLFLLWQFQVLHTWFHTDTFTLPVPSKIVHIMLDNMDTDTLKEAIAYIDGRAEIEVSGNVTKENITRLINLGVDFVSSGALTHSAPILDISLKNLHPVQA